ncbi:MAG: hypothetical protein IJ619_10420 [Eubacterium sp.]|nr:hypothetical protein [Eubacterium sp.]
MARQKKDGEFRTFKLSKDIIIELDNYSDQASMSKTAVVENALKLYFDKLSEMSRDKKVSV